MVPFDPVNDDYLLSDQLLEDIKVRCCFVTTQQRSRDYFSQFAASLDGTQLNSSNSEQFKFVGNAELNVDSGKRRLVIPGLIREFACEHLFTDTIDDQHQSLSNFILETLTKCPMDLKRNLAENIILIGGTCMIPGFKCRLSNEIDFLISKTNNTSKYSNKFNYNFAYHTPPSKDNSTAWLGGSIFAQLDILDMCSISNLKYKNSKQVPDWFTINDNNDNQKHGIK
jgi:actin-related protein 10